MGGLIWLLLLPFEDFGGFDVTMVVFVWVFVDFSLFCC